MRFVCADHHNKRVEQTEYRDEGADTATRLGQVLTDEEMHQIWSDLARISTPTWVTPIPLDLGSASHGKLKADQWRTLGITHLLLSLMRLWGLRDSNDPRSQKCRELLDVTISLISAVILASSRVTSPSIAAAYLTHMKAYMEGIKKLFPQYRFRPNHHMALHLHEYLCRFGPVHSWWTFPFERIIGMLQRIPTNFKIGGSYALFFYLYLSIADRLIRVFHLGQFEHTISESFTRSANLRAFIYKTKQCPPAILACQTIFRRLVDPRIRNTLICDMATFEPTTDVQAAVWNPRTATKIPPNLRNILLHYDSSFEVEKAQFLKQLIVVGLRYTVSEKHFGNSCVLLKRPLLSDHCPAIIVSILKVRTSLNNLQTLLVVRRYKSLPSSTPISSLGVFPVLGVTLWSPDCNDLEIFRPEDIICHFASLPFEYQGHRAVKIPLIIVISLARVSFIPFSFMYQADPSPVHEQVLQTTDLEAMTADDPDEMDTSM